MKPYRILVIGSNGQLGRELKEYFARHGGEDLNIVYADRSVVDITDLRKLLDFISRGNFSHIVNCAAYTAVDRAEKDKEECWKVNFEGVRNLVACIKNTSIRLIHISTDYVFDGKKKDSDYSEDDTPSPLSEYGRSKLAGEEVVLKECPHGIVIRTGWLYSAHGHNFVKTIIEKAKQGQSLKVVNDQWGTPTQAADLASTIATIIQSERWTPGVFHYSGSGATTWYDFATEILKLAGITVPIVPCRSIELNQLATRPQRAVLSKAKIESVYGVEIPRWQDSLAKFMHGYLSETRDNQRLNS